MKKTVLIIGRFQPFHIGHLELVKRYYQAGFFIKIGIGSSKNNYEKDNPLNSKEREEIIRRVMKEFNIKRYKIYHISDISKNTAYVNHVRKIVGNFNTIVTGNPKVLSLFLKYKSKKPWNIESFEESSGRPGGKINASIIREKWTKKPSKVGIAKTTYYYLKEINFSERLKKSK